MLSPATSQDPEPRSSLGRRQRCSHIWGWMMQGSWSTPQPTLLFLSPKELYTAPDSCKGRCEEPYSKEDECHCDAECESHYNCCEDYYEHCRPGGHCCLRRGLRGAAGARLWGAKGWFRAGIHPLPLRTCAHGPGQPQPASPSL